VYIRLQQKRLYYKKGSGQGLRFGVLFIPEPFPELVMTKVFIPEPIPKLVITKGDEAEGAACYFCLRCVASSHSFLFIPTGVQAYIAAEC
jgi:hypothetical protein